jgi:hypothetical protein
MTDLATSGGAASRNSATTFLPVKPVAPKMTTSNSFSDASFCLVEEALEVDVAHVSRRVLSVAIGNSVLIEMMLISRFVVWSQEPCRYN